MPNALSALGLSKASSAILEYFALRPRASSYLRELQRLLGLGSASVQRELDRLVGAGALYSEGRRNLIRYRAGDDQFWQSIRTLMATNADPSELVRQALLDVPGIAAGFIFGSRAAHTERPESDIDLFLVADEHFNRRLFFERVADMGLLFSLDLRPICYDIPGLAARLGQPHVATPFVRDVIGGPKTWVAGSPERIAPIVTAAGFRPEALMS